VDGVCCEGACDGTCVSCNQSGRAGKCSAYAQGSDPETECTFGLGACRATCNGAGACDYPRAGTPCGIGCQSCDGNGMCVASCGSGGASGRGGVGGLGAAGGASGRGGASGSGGMMMGGIPSLGGAIGSGGAIMGGSVGQGGVGGTGGSAIGGSAIGGEGGRAGTGGAKGSPDGGRDALTPSSPDSGRNPSDAASADGTGATLPPDGGGTLRLIHGGCNCNLGPSASGTIGRPLALLGAALWLWRVRRRRWLG
jgi:hypothetical protein